MSDSVIDEGAKEAARRLVNLVQADEEEGFKALEKICAKIRQLNGMQEVSNGQKED